MRVILILVFLCVCVNSFGEIYKAADHENDCDLYMSTSSLYIQDFDLNELEKVSSMPALVFQKSNGQFNLKGLWSLVTITKQVKTEGESIEELMGHTFNSVCLSTDKSITHLEKGRRLFNNLNNLDEQ